MISVALSKILAVTGWALLLLGAIQAWWALKKTDSAVSSRIGWTWWAILGIALICLRWPLLWVPHQQNPDESQLIAGAITLSHDPIFWRSVDGGTAGPMDFYPLMPASWVEGAASYAVARGIGLALFFATMILAGETVAFVAGASWARLAVLPAVAFFALTTTPDFNHYSTEIMPAFLLAAAGWVAFRQRGAMTVGSLWFFAFLTGSVVWAKLQAIPLAAALWVVIASREVYWGRLGSVLPLVGGAALPVAIFLGMTTLTGETENLIVPYLAQNFAYVQKPQFTWFGVALAQWDNARLDGYLAWWLGGVATTTALALILGFKSASITARRAVVVTLLLTSAALFSTLGPRRPSTHHLYLMVVPLVWLTGAAFALKTSDPHAWRQRVIGGIFLGLCVFSQLIWRGLAPDPFAGINASGVNDERRALATLVRTLASRDEPLAMWGWRCSLYVEAGRRQATRQAHTEAQIYESKLQSYFLRRYLEDFETSNPPVFVDAVGPGNFAFESPRFAHEVFSPLREIVGKRYTFVAILDGTRVYARNDRLEVLKRALPAAPATR